MTSRRGFFGTLGALLAAQFVPLRWLSASLLRETRVVDPLTGLAVLWLRTKPGWYEATVTVPPEHAPRGLEVDSPYTFEVNLKGERVVFRAEGKVTKIDKRADAFEFTLAGSESLGEDYQIEFQ